MNSLWAGNEPAARVGKAKALKANHLGKLLNSRLFWRERKYKWASVAATRVRRGRGRGVGQRPQSLYLSEFVANISETEPAFSQVNRRRLPCRRGPPISLRRLRDGLPKDHAGRHQVMGHAVAWFCGCDIARLFIAQRRGQTTQPFLRQCFPGIGPR